MAHPIFIAKLAETGAPPERLRRRFANLSGICATAAGGVDRRASRAADIETHRLIIFWAVARKWRIQVDRIGHLFNTRPGAQGLTRQLGT